jgi:broad specificity phosphatase PhoE
MNHQPPCRIISFFTRQQQHYSPIRILRGGQVPSRTFASPSTEEGPKVIQRPKRIILIRHGESLGNVDESAYVATPDWKVPLTPNGRQQAFQAGKDLKSVVGNGQVFCYYSPYSRTKETMNELCQHLQKDQIISIREEPRISEQQFGNFQNVEQVLQAKQERHEFGRFYYRFKSGEAGLDVYSRVSSFISTLVRDCQQYQKAGYDLDNINVVIVTHGLSLRLFLMRWFQFSVEEFEASDNPKNAQLIVMEKRCFGGHRWYELTDEHRKSLRLPETCGVPKNVQLHHLTDNDDL